MSHNEQNLDRSARNHRPAIIAIVVALLVAAVAYFVFMPGTNEQNEGIATTPPPAGIAVPEAEGTDAAAGTPISPEGAAPVGAEPEASGEGAAPASN